MKNRNNKEIIKFLGILNDLNWKKKEKSMGEFRGSFNRRIEKMIKEMETARK